MCTAESSGCFACVDAERAIPVVHWLTQAYVGVIGDNGVAIVVIVGVHRPGDSLPLESDVHPVVAVDPIPVHLPCSAWRHRRATIQNIHQAI